MIRLPGQKRATIRLIAPQKMVQEVGYDNTDSPLALYLVLFVGIPPGEIWPLSDGVTRITSRKNI
jgi:hypothetical protein